MNLIQVEAAKKMTTLEIKDEINFFREQEGNRAELKHPDLLKVVRSEFSEEIDEGNISSIFYTDSMNRKKPMFELTINQAKQILLKESKIVRRAVIKKLDELEKAEKSKYLNQEERNFKLTLDLNRINELEKMAKNIFDKKKGILSTVVAEYNNTSAIKLNRTLCELGVITKEEGKQGWFLTAKTKGRGLAEITRNGRITRWTGKGNIYINGCYKANEVLFMEENQLSLFN